MRSIQEFRLNNVIYKIKYQEFPIWSSEKLKKTFPKHWLGNKCYMKNYKSQNKTEKKKQLKK